MKVYDKIKVKHRCKIVEQNVMIKKL